MKRACPVGAQWGHERRNSDQRNCAGNPRSRARERRTSGNLRRAHQPAGLVSNLCKGRVSRVLPGMQAAFVDIGLERSAFLHAADIAFMRSPDETMVALPAIDDIRRLVNQGDEILVQVIKDPIGTKGARLTTFVALPSRYLVYIPRGDGVGVSTRIEDEAERTRLKTLITGNMRSPEAGGYIVRTAASGVSAEGLAEDMAYLDKLWDHVRETSLRTKPG